MSQVSAKRQSFEEEKKYSWLPLLLDSYALIDQGVYDDIKQQSENNRVLACQRGCANCCRSHKEIPVLPLELVGITWYCTEKINAETRDQLISQLESDKDLEHCPFLINNECAIHVLRPTACRIFNVFNQACQVSEDAYYTRPDDVLKPNRDYINKAYYLTLDFYNVRNEKNKQQIISENGLDAIATDLHKINWQSLADKMREFDALK